MFFDFLFNVANLLCYGLKGFLEVGILDLQFCAGVSEFIIYLISGPNLPCCFLADICCCDIVVVSEVVLVGAFGILAYCSADVRP